jgi:hypothetical protein
MSRPYDFNRTLFRYVAVLLMLAATMRGAILLLRMHRP